MIKLTNKTKLIAILIILALGIVFIYLLSREKGPGQEIPISPTAAPTPIAFEILNIFPSEGTQTGNPFIAAQFEFSKPISLTDLEVNIKPTIKASFSTNETGDTLIIKPEPQWQYGTTYSIEVSNIVSEDGEPLGRNLTQSFQIEQMTDSPLVE